MSELGVAAGQIIAGKYRVVSLLGTGGMASVWRVEHLTLDAHVALKVLKPAIAERKSSRVRFLREAKAAARLRSPHVVQILDYGGEGELAFISMELLDGESLAQRLRRQAPLSQELIARIVTHIGRALSRAHSGEIVHRDLKPDNVFLVDNDGEIIAKVLDFGIAKSVSSSFDEVGGPQTKTGTMLGTPYYMSPEQLISSRDVDHRCDLWALGVIVHECVCRVRPFRGETIGDLVLQICERPLPKPSQRCAVPPGLDGWFLKAVARDPDDRFQSATEMVDRLCQVLAETLVDSHSLDETCDAPIDRISRDGDAAPQSETEAAETEAAETEPSVDEMLAGEHEPTGSASSSDGQGEQEAGLSATKVSPAATPDVAVQPRPEPPVGRWRSLLPLAVLLFTLGGALAVWQLTDTTSGAGAASSASSSTRSVPTTKSRVAAPKAANAKAVKAYQRAEDAVNSGQNTAAMGALKEALEHDPNMAAAHLALALVDPMSDLQVTRRHLRAAHRRRDQLSERDRILLDAMEPLILRESTDFAEGARRLKVGLARFPDDSILAYHHASLVGFEEPARAVQLLERARQRSPGNVPILLALTEFRAYRGAFDKALESAAECSKHGPATARCTYLAALVYEQRGQCGLYEQTARQAIAREPDEARGFQLLARALAATGKARPAVEVVLRQYWLKMAKPLRWLAPIHEIRVGLLYGDFAHARAAIDKLSSRAASEPGREIHAQLARVDVALKLELGKKSKGAKAAQTFLETQAGWETDPRNESYAIAADVLPDMWRALRAAGQLSADALVVRRTRWLAGWEKRKVSKFNRRYLWQRGFAAAVFDSVDAKGALGAMPEYGPVPPLRPATLAAAHIGRAHLLAGKSQKAIFWLEQAKAACRALQFPILHTQALAWLGQALERNKQTAAACAAYGVVLDRWGKVDKSRTARHARQRRKALACD